MSAHAVPMPSLAGLCLHAPTGMQPGDSSSDSGSSTPPPAVMQMYGNLQSAAALAEQAKLALAQARAAAVAERKAAQAAAKTSAAAARAAERAAEQEVKDNEQEAKNDILWKAHKLKQQAAREAALERVKVVMEQLEWPKNQGRELPKKDRERLLRELFEAQKTIDRTAQTWAQLSKNRRKYKEQLALIEEAREWRENAKPVAKMMGNILKQRRSDKSKFEKDMAKHAKKRKEAKVQQQRTDRHPFPAVAATTTAAESKQHGSSLEGGAGEGRVHAPRDGAAAAAGDDDHPADHAHFNPAEYNLFNINISDYRSTVLTGHCLKKQYYEIPHEISRGFPMEPCGFPVDSL